MSSDRKDQSRAGRRFTEHFGAPSEFWKARLTDTRLFGGSESDNTTIRKTFCFPSRVLRSFRGSFEPSPPRALPQSAHRRAASVNDIDAREKENRKCLERRCSIAGPVVKSRRGGRSSASSKLKIPQGRWPHPPPGPAYPVALDRRSEVDANADSPTEAQRGFKEDLCSAFAETAQVANVVAQLLPWGPHLSCSAASCKSS